MSSKHLRGDVNLSWPTGQASAGSTPRTLATLER
jgi:hypothetical protein